MVDAARKRIDAAATDALRSYVHARAYELPRRVDYRLARDRIPAVGADAIRAANQNVLAPAREGKVQLEESAERRAYQGPDLRTAIVEHQPARDERAAVCKVRVVQCQRAIGRVKR